MGRLLDCFRVAAVAAIFLAAISLAHSQNVAVQHGRRFPLGVQLGDSPNCTHPDDEGLLRFYDNAVQVCRAGEWSQVASQEDVDGVNSLVSNLTDSNEDLRDRVVQLEESVFPPISLGTLNERVESSRRQQAIAMCNNNGEYDLELLRCRCFCNAEQGCWDHNYHCTRCASGWIMDNDRCTGDVEAPTISILGANPLVHEAGGVYNDPGATAHDNKDLNMTSLISAVSTVDIEWPGTYDVTYTVTDNAGNTATEVRVVEVVDTTAPVISRNGAAVVTHEAGDVYADAGAAAADNAAGLPPITVHNPVVDDIPGVYVVEYSVTDPSGNSAVNVTRTVYVVDTTSPEITVHGDVELSHEAGMAYFDAGASAVDNSGVSLPPISVSENVNISLVGSYVVNYTVSDADGNSDFAQRIVHIVDTTAPTITIIGDGVVTINQFEVYVDDGAFAEDNALWSELPRSNINEGYLVSVSNGVNTAETGVHSVVYTFVDGAALSASATRAVVVVDVDECSGAAGGHDCPLSTQHCVNVNGTYECHCNSGFSGVGSGQPATECSDVDECLTNNGDCDPSAVCTNTVGSRECHCEAPFYGDGLSCATVGGSTEHPADSCQHILDVHTLAGVPDPVSGAYWILPYREVTASPVSLYCDFDSNPGTAFSLVLKSTSSTNGMYQTGAVSTSGLSTVETVSFSKVSDTFWNAMRPEWNWAICASYQSFLKWDSGSTWSSSHGTQDSCSYNSGYYSAIALTWGGSEHTAIDRSACGGMRVTVNGVSGYSVLSGIHDSDNTNRGCYTGSHHTSAPTIYGSTSSSSGNNNWNNDGYVLLATSSTCVDSDCGSSSSKPVHSCKALKDLDYLHNRTTPTGAYWIRPNGYSGAAVQLYCDMDTDGGGWTLVQKSIGNSQNHRLTSEVSTSSLDEVSTVTVAKVSDVFYRALRPRSTWNICNGRQTVYYWRAQDLWVSNHGSPSSCSYNLNYWTGTSTSPGGAVLGIGSNQACGGGYVTDGNTSSWGVLSGIYANDGQLFGCYSGSSFGTTAAPAAYDAVKGDGGFSAWNRNGFVLVR